MFGHCEFVQTNQELIKVPNDYNYAFLKNFGYQYNLQSNVPSFPEYCKAVGHHFYLFSRKTRIH